LAEALTFYAHLRKCTIVQLPAINRVTFFENSIELTAEEAIQAMEYLLEVNGIALLPQGESQLKAYRILDSTGYAYIRSNDEQSSPSPRIPFRRDSGKPKSTAALRKEVEHGTTTLQDILSKKRGALGTVADDNDVKSCIEAAGALADAGDSSGFALVKTTIQSFPRTGYAWTAARILPKFAKFKQQSKDIDAVALLLAAADDTIKAIEDTPKEGKKDEYSFHGGSMMIIARSLAEVGGPEARAKLLQATSHADPKVREHAKTFLNKLDQKSSPAGTPVMTP
jgi:hypothetical protein